MNELSTLKNHIKTIWNKLGEDIYRGEKEKRNIAILRRVGLTFAAIMVFFVILNHIQGRIVAEIACLLIAISMIAGSIIISVTGRRFYSALIVSILTSVILTIYMFDGTNDGFAILWSLLLPVGIMYFVNVKIGMLQCLYLEIVFIISCYTPLRQAFLVGKYTDTFLNRWPILYGTAVIIFSAAMVQYHLNALRQYEYDDELQSEIAKQTAKSEKRRLLVEKMSGQMVDALTSAIDAKDTYTNGHSNRVAKYSLMIAQRSGLFTDYDMIKIEYAAVLHDIGKIGVPDTIINKTSKLDDEEYSIIKIHPGLGGDILSTIDVMPEIMIGARWHHERYDGTGYPDGLAGEDIPVIARIICVADSYDAMTSNRSYRHYMEQKKAREEIIKGRGTQFDPTFADIMIQIIDEDTGYELHE